MRTRFLLGLCFVFFHLDKGSAEMLFVRWSHDVTGERSSPHHVHAHAAGSTIKHPERGIRIDVRSTAWK